MSDLTIVICGYKATKELKLCLHQLLRYHIPMEDVLIYENSPEDYTDNREFLDSIHLKYINNPGGSHCDTMNRAMKEVKTDYALLLDSDCFIMYDPRYFVNIMRHHGIQLCGDICGSRSGLHLHKRVHPWWCLVDMKHIRHFNIQFNDIERTKATHSESFIDIKQLGDQRDRRGFYYDVGATMYEDVIATGGICMDIGDYKPYIHKEGSSWYGESTERFQKAGQLKDSVFGKLLARLQYDESIFDSLKNG